MKSGLRVEGVHMDGPTQYQFPLQRSNTLACISRQNDLLQTCHFSQIFHFQVNNLDRNLKLCTRACIGNTTIGVHQIHQLKTCFTTDPTKVLAFSLNFLF